MFYEGRDPLATSRTKEHACTQWRRARGPLSEAVDTLLCQADITHYESEQVIAIHIPQKRYELFESFALRPANSGTEVTMRMEFQPAGFSMNALAVILRPLKGLILGRSIKGTLAQLGRAVNS